MADLQPCPFCGQRAEYYSESRYGGEVTWSDGLGSPGPLYYPVYSVKCVGDGLRPHNTGCGASVYGGSEADAIARWNRRVASVSGVARQEESK